MLLPESAPPAPARETGAGAGEFDVDNIMRFMMESFLPEEHQLLLNGELSKEQIEVFRAQIEEKVAEALGPIEKIFGALDDITPDVLEELEDKATEYLRGKYGEDILDFLNNFEAPELTRAL